VKKGRQTRAKKQFIIDNPQRNQYHRDKEGNGSGGVSKRTTIFWRKP
jgi:hypothetical protein